MHKLYLAGPLFTLAERNFNVELTAALRQFDNIQVWLPQEHEPRENTAKSIFDLDVQGVKWCNTIVANMDGPDPDSGTCWEVGCAYALGKRIILYRADIRCASDFEGSPYNLMLSQSADALLPINPLQGDDVAKIAARIAERLDD
jgi:nucleoside 2-deoxyribosyltransferase